MTVFHMNRSWIIGVKSIFILCIWVLALIRADVCYSQNKSFNNADDISIDHIDSLNKAAFAIFRTDPSKTRLMAEKTKMLSEKIGYITGMGKAWNYIAMTHHISGSWDSAQYAYQNALDLFSSDADSVNIGKIYNNLGLLATAQGFYNISLDYYLLSLNISLPSGDISSIFHNYNNIGITYEKLEQYENAINAYENGLKYLDPVDEYKELYYYAQSNIGVINLLTHNYDSAFLQLSRGLQYFISVDDNYGIEQSYRYLAELYIESGKFSDAGKALDSTRKYASLIGDKKVLAESAFYRAKLDYSKGDINAAEKGFQKLLTVARENGYEEMEVKLLSLLSSIDSLQRDYYSALLLQQQYFQAFQHQNSLKLRNQVAEFNVRYETLQKNREIALLKANEEVQKLKITKHVQQRNLLLVILIVVLLFGLFVLILSYKLRAANSSLELKNREIETKNQALHRHQNHLEELVDERTTELVKARDKARESDRLKSAFLANISHEIRTPMNGILGFVDLLQEHNLDDQQRIHYVDVIRRSSNRMLNIIGQLVDISRIETGQEVANITLVELSEMIDQLKGVYGEEAYLKNLSFTADFHPELLSLKIKTDKKKMETILSNLLRNALKYTDEGGLVFGAEYTNSMKNSIRFFVRDTGCGIPQDRKEAIFNCFVQADIEDRNALQGAGLGLSISKAYADMLEGKLWVEDNDPQGTTFYFEISVD